MRELRLGWVGWLMLTLMGCFQATQLPVSQGGETHFLATCTSSCADGFSCVCGVCTKACTTVSSCASLGTDATCVAADGVGDTRDCSMQATRGSAAVCDKRCVSADDCAGLGSATACRGGLCREPVAASSLSASGTAGDAGADASGPPGPIVLMLLDTSGSLEKVPASVCTCPATGDPACVTCLPDCSLDDSTQHNLELKTNRWAHVVSAMSGSFVNFGCTSLERTTANGATYDVGYNLPYHRINADVIQREDGVLDTYAPRIRFGLATFDGMETYFGSNPLIPTASFDRTLSDAEQGMFSYAGQASNGTPRRRPDGSLVGDFFYPRCTESYLMDTGIRAASATDGAFTVTRTLQEMHARTANMKKIVRNIRPYGGTPTAAALDDLYVAFTEDKNAYANTARDSKRYVVLVTDGVPDTDYREYGCACKTAAECMGSDPKLMHCPYPTAAEAALHLRCGFGSSGTCAGPIDGVYVVGLSITGAADRGQLDAIAAAGGTSQARYVDAAELRSTLGAVLDDILAVSSSR